ncbi:MAG: AMP-binding protein [Hamadaea sp.]|uniref:AMP-binding protein n=1 Tax=Hamadaea sp. TaxID=2024425 RepID=UPI0018534E2B|nr:AMP-binding protein [Hamadaea sp.]NUR72247.1 AMP-binding protein [Hamadaea sp.]NUT17678.1 AMP-binding protein [Hamadaea sp.]
MINTAGGRRRMLWVLAKRGLLNPGPPGKIVSQLATLKRWGFSVAGELRAAAERSPDRLAVIDPEGSYTYAELWDRAEKLALALRVRHGIGVGGRVGVLARNHAGMITAMVAGCALGAEVVLLNPALSAAAIDAVAHDQRIELVIADNDLMELIPGVPAVNEVAVEKLIADAPPGKLTPPVRAGRLIVLTSGTTAAPKGARRKTPGGLGPLASVIDRIPLKVGDRIFVAAPLFHTWGLAALQVALALRATVVLQRRFEPLSTIAAIRDLDCQGLIAVPVMVQRLLEATTQPGITPRVVAVSGSALPGGLATAFMDAYGDCLYNLYGSTEASWVSIATPEDLRRDPRTAGRPPLGTTVEIRSRSGHPLPTGEIGQIHVRNDMLFEGYTSSREGTPNGLLGTGDLGHFDDHGLLYVDGRADDMIISGGENVFPRPVEELIGQLPQVREVAVVGVPDPEFGQRLAAYVVLHPGERLDSDSVREYVRHYLARFCVPREVVFLPELPRTATGKVIPRLLR